VPSTVREQPSSIVKVASNATVPANTCGFRCARSLGVHDRLAGEFLGDVARIGERLLTEADGPLDEVVVVLDADLAQAGAEDTSSPIAMNPL